MTTLMLLGWWMLGYYSMEQIVKLFIYILDGQYKRVRLRLPSNSHYHNSNITFPNIIFIYIAILGITVIIFISKTFFPIDIMALLI